MSLSFTRQSKVLETKMNALETGEKNKETMKKKLYANAVKQTNVKPDVVIKPKNKHQASKKTHEERSQRLGSMYVALYCVVRMPIKQKKLNSAGKV